MHYLIFGIVLTIAAVTFLGAYLLSKFLPAITTEPPQPHKCPKGDGWKVHMRQGHLPFGERFRFELPHIQGDGEIEVKEVEHRRPVSVFEGFFCTECGKRLACGNCKNAHEETFVVENTWHHDRILKCCRNPVFADSDRLAPNMMHPSGRIPEA